MPRYFDADKLLEQVKSLEQLARKRVHDTPTSSAAYERYAAQHQERVRMLAILNAQATADVVEVVRCREILVETMKAERSGVLPTWFPDESIELLAERLIVRMQERRKAVDG